jgi:hypothetical protein
MKRLGDQVKRELGRFGPAAGLSELVAAWSESVGETIARNAWPARIARDGTLHVNTLDSIWAFELTSRAGDIASRVGVERIRFAPGRLPEAPSEAPEQGLERRSESSEEARIRGDQLAAGIEDENLRKIVARAAAASLSRAADSRSV